MKSLQASIVDLKLNRTEWQRKRDRRMYSAVP